MKSNRNIQQRGLLLALLILGVMLVPSVAQASGLNSPAASLGAVNLAQVATPSPTATETPCSLQICPTVTPTPCIGRICNTNTPTATSTLTPTDTPTPTASPTITPTDTLANTATSIPTDTPTNTPTNTPTSTFTPPPGGGTRVPGATNTPPSTNTPLATTSTPPALTATASPTVAATTTAAPSATVALLPTATALPTLAAPTVAPATPTSAVPISVGAISETSAAVSSTQLAGPLEASKSADVNGAAVGSNINFTIKTRNRSRTVTLTNVVVIDTVPLQLAIDSVMTSRPTDVSVNGQVVVLKLGTLLPGESVTTRIATTVRADLGSGVQNIVYVNSNEIQGLIVSITIGSPPGLPQTGNASAASLPLLLLIAALLLSGLGLLLRGRRRQIG